MAQRHFYNSGRMSELYYTAHLLIIEFILHVIVFMSHLFCVTRLIRVRCLNGMPHLRSRGVCVAILLLIPLQP